MNRFIWICWFGTFGGWAASAQTVIPLWNGSFELDGQAGGGVVPRNWTDCGFYGTYPPDIHQSGDPDPLFGVRQHSPFGSFFLGMVTRSDDTWEALSQPLKYPLLPGQAYEWSLALAKAPCYQSSDPMTGEPDCFAHPIILQCWGGRSACHFGELLAESPPVSHSEFKHYTFTLRPTGNFDYLIIRAFYPDDQLPRKNGNILVDDISYLYELEN